MREKNGLMPRVDLADNVTFFQKKNGPKFKQIHRDVFSSFEDYVGLIPRIFVCSIDIS